MVTLPLLLLLLLRVWAVVGSSHLQTIPVQSLRRPSTLPCAASGTAAEPTTSPSALLLEHARGPCPTDNTTTWETMFRQALDADAARLRRLSLPAASAGTAKAVSGGDTPVESGRKFSTGNYVVTVGVGTPTQRFRLTIDTGSDITWLQCLPCGTNDSAAATSASGSSCYSQVDPIFDPATSSSYAAVACVSPLCAELAATENVPACVQQQKTCTYQARYGDGSETSGDFSLETFRIANTAIKQFPLGCGHDNRGLFRGTAGLLGLGRGQLAFPARTASVFGDRFAYCLPDFGDPAAAGTLHLGSDAVPRGATFTPLLVDDEPSSSSSPYYMVATTAVTVGAVTVTTPSSASSGRTVVDSGTVITRLAPELYEAVLAAWRNQTAELPTAPSFSILETCYDFRGMREVRIPRVWIEYGGGGGRVEISTVGLLAPVRSDLSQVCLALAREASALRLGFNILGNFQQQRTRVVYDNSRLRLGFAPELCSSSSSSSSAPLP